MITLAFDVYGTLIDTQGITTELEAMIGNKAEIFAKSWREKQLEYSFRRGLMQNYQDFSVCTSQALDFTCLQYQEPLNPAQKSRLLQAYRTLPPFDEVKQSLTELAELDIKLFAFSNGTYDAVKTLLEHAQIAHLFNGIVSVDDVKTFKPSPATYSHFLRQADANSNTSYLISSNLFDVNGALSHGMHAIWVNRENKSIFDPWEFIPDATLEGLDELKGALRLG